MATTAIEWAEMVWNPIVGCTPVSPGCLNCYAASMAIRLRGMDKRGYRDGDVELRIEGKNPSPPAARDPLPQGEREGRPIAERKNGRAVFTGSVRFVEDALTIPLRRKKPTVWFVNSMSDLFHEDVPFDTIDRIFAVMALCCQHTFMVLTKRPERMAEWVESIANEDEVAGSFGMMRLGCAAGTLLDGEWIWEEGKRHRDSIEHFISDTHEWDDEDTGREAKDVLWPLPNVVLGASVEDQPRADTRVPIVARPGRAGWRTFLSAEPLIEAVDLGDVRGIGRVIVGGESGPGSRPCNVAWIRDIIRQCRDANVPVFVKQLGARPIDKYAARDLPDSSGDAVVCLRDPKGGDMAEWPEDLRVREPERGGAG